MPSPAASPAETRPHGAIHFPKPRADASDQNLAFSPDGVRLVFTRFDKGCNLGPAGLFLLDLSNQHATRLTPVEDQDNANLPGSARLDGEGDGHTARACIGGLAVVQYHHSVS